MTKSAEHTKGPLTARPTMTNHGTFPIYNADGVYIGGAALLDTIYSGYGEARDEISRTSEGQREAWANALLWAAAPALLEALEGLLDALDTDDVGGIVEGFMDHARAVLAAAKGAQ